MSELRLLAACGLVCSECPALLATRANDLPAITRIAAEWSAQFHVNVTPEHVWCDGCMTASARRCHHCSECEIRACVAGRGLQNCASCADYPCERSAAFHAMVPMAKANIDAIRA